MQLRRLLLLPILLTSLAVPTFAAADTPLTLRRVLLSTGGVGYFEFEAEADGDATLALEVRLDQVDDVLKSIVVFDDKGGIGGIELPGREPLAQVFRDLPFGPEALASPQALLNALQGAEVAVAGVRPLKGRVLRVLAEQTQIGNGLVTTRHRVSLVTAQGLRQFVLEEADSVVFTDPELQGQVEQALAATTLHRARDKRRLHIFSRGQGKRLVRVAYVVAAPLWKASYRLTLDADPTGKEGLLQGWAVIENLSGLDWNEIELTVVSGNPVTFRQALYQAYYVDRPEVPVEVMGRVLPRLDTGVVGGAEAKARDAERSDSLGRVMLRAEASASSRAAPTAPPPAVPPAAPMEQAQAATPVAAEEATTQVAFRFGQPISVTSGNSLVVPIVDRKVPAERLSLYQPATQASHPLASVRLTNDGESGLPPGVLTLYERAAGQGLAFVGDARMAPLPAGEKRLLSFAIDNKVKVSREEKSVRRIAGGKLSRGVLQLTRTERLNTVYRVAAPAREARRLLIEHPLLPGWRLVQPKEEGIERTGTDYRLAHQLAAGEEREIAVVMERPISELLRLVDLQPPQIAAFVAADELSEPVRAAFRQLRELKGALDAARRVLEQNERRQQAVGQDQERIRGNLGRVPRESALYQRYLDKLNEQESELERLLTQGDLARQNVQTAEERLAAFVEKLEVQ
jgi:hypothetical protein